MVLKTVLSSVSSRRKPSEGGLVLAALLICLHIGVPAPGQKALDAKRALARKIHETIERIHTRRAERLRLREQHQAHTGEVERQIERMKDEIERTGAVLREERKRVEELGARLEAARKIKRKGERLLSKAVEVAMPSVEKMTGRVSSGIPCRRKERREQIERIMAGLRSSVLREQADALVDYSTFHAEELRLANSIDLWNEPVLLDGGKREVHAYQIRLGLVNQFFVSEDGRTIGLAVGEVGREWDLKPDPVQCRQIRTALEILQERRPPGVFSVPFGIPTSSSSREKPQANPASDPGRSED